MQGPCWVPNPQQAKGTAACAAPAPSAASAAGTLLQRPARVSHPVSQASTCVSQLSHLRRATTPHKLIKTLPALTSCLRTHLETRFVQERSLRSGLPAPNAEESTENSAARSTSSVGARGALSGLATPPGGTAATPPGGRRVRSRWPHSKGCGTEERLRRQAVSTRCAHFKLCFGKADGHSEQELGRASPGNILPTLLCILCCLLKLVNLTSVPHFPVACPCSA